MNKINEELMIIQHQKAEYNKRLLEIDECMLNLKRIKAEYDAIVKELTLEELRRVVELSKNDI